MNEFTHFNQEGRAKMVDISQKPTSVRTAIAETSVTLQQSLYQLIQTNGLKKGDVLAVAQVAGIMAAKKTSEIIPMCHPILLNGIDINFSWRHTDQEEVQLVIRSIVRTKGHTGVEMEALTAVSAAALTVYDMCKAVDKGIIIGSTYLVEKTGGTSSADFKRKEEDIHEHQS